MCMLPPVTNDLPARTPGSRVRLSAFPSRRGDAIVARERTARLAPGLVGRPLPEVDLVNCEEKKVELPHAGASGLVIYTFPGTLSSPDGGERTVVADAAQHRAFDQARRDLEALSFEIVGMSGEPPRAQRLRVIEHRVCHSFWSDPDLAFARALGLPTFSDSAGEAYRRLTIVARDRRIVKAFFPVDRPERSAAQVICWLKASGY